jgi:hypothetical protein
VESEAEEFAFSARNELDWLNEHMAEIFDENQLYVEALSQETKLTNCVETWPRYLKHQGDYAERHHELRGSAILLKHAL